MRRITPALLLIAMFFSFAPITTAHTIPQSSLITWGEEIGWAIDESKHTNGTLLEYHFDPDDPYISAYVSRVRQAATLWAGTVSIQEANTVNGMIMTDYASSATYIAYYIYNWKYEPSGHVGDYEIVLNRYYDSEINSVVIAHEFGHAIGLKDLYSDRNKNKLMYGYRSLTANGPTLSDTRGARVITGQHQSHQSWEWVFHKSNTTGNEHRMECPTCNGYRYIESCTYVNDICTKCRVPKKYISRDEAAILVD